MNDHTKESPTNSRSKFRSTRTLLAITAVFGIAALVAVNSHFRGLAIAAPNEATDAENSSDRFDSSGTLRRPDNYREWVFLGAAVTPNDMNGGKAAFPEFHNVYLDPASFASYKQTGEIPNGAVIIKELVSVGGKAMPSGKGYFQGDFVSLEAMVKDTKRFADEPGGWAFFRFGEAPNYKPVGARMKTESCNSCHAGADEDYVFTSTYPVLRAAKPKAAAN